MLPNATTHIQPCDQGIIHSLKCFYKKGFINNRIDAYDSVHDKPNEDPPAFTILDAIYLVADAWKNVTRETIANCWKRTGILPINDNNNELPIQLPNIEHEQVYELNEMIARLPIDNPLSADEFLHLDDVLPIEEMPDDMILIEQIRHEHDDIDTQSDDDGDGIIEPLRRITLQEGNRSAKDLVEFLLQQDDGFCISAEELEIVRRVSESIKRKEMNSRRQVSIMHFFK